MITSARPRVLVVICVVCLGAALGLGQLSGVQRIESWSRGQRFIRRDTRPSPTTDHLTLVTIDDATLAKIPKPMMMWGPELGQAIHHLHEAGVTTVGLDLLQTISMADWYPDNDRELAVALAESPHTVLISMWQSGQAGGGKLLEPTEQLKYALTDPLTQIGFADLYPDPDGAIHRITFSDTTVKASSWSFSSLVASHAATVTPAQLARDYQQPVSRWAHPSLLINYVGPPNTFRRIPFYQLIDSGWNAATRRALASRLKGQIVLIGVDYTGCQDYQLTPFYSQASSNLARRMAGVEIHANMVASLLDHRSLQVVTPLIQSLLLCLFIILSCAGFLRLRLWAGLLQYAVFTAGWMLVAFWLFQHDILLGLAQPLLAITFTLFCCIAYRFFSEFSQRQYIFDIFGRFVSYDVAQHLVAKREPLNLGGERMSITVLVADLRGFSVFCESADEQEAIAYLNEFFRTVVPVITRYQGTVDKFIGDAVMAVFGAPLYSEDHALRAVCCAIDMQHELTVLKERLAATDGPAIDFGIGIHTGQAIVGHVGVVERMEYSVVGHTVNLAFRLEEANKQIGSHILISEDVAQVIGTDFLLEGPIPLQVKMNQFYAFRVTAESVPTQFAALGNGTARIASKARHLHRKR